MSKRIWVLGAQDPEMNAIEKILRESGEHIAYAVDERGARVAPSSAYRATDAVDEAGAVVDLAGSQVYFVECAIPGVTGTVIDHHRPGDPGYGQPPAEFLSASSIGQTIKVLAMDELPEDIVIAAAADHCLAAAYRGECPGVDPEKLLKWRVETRARHQGRAVEDILADVERAREALRGAPSLRLAESAPEARDMRGYGLYRRTTVLVVPYVEGATCDASGTGDSSTLVVGRNLPTGAWDEGSHHTFVARVRDDVPELQEAACVDGLAYLAQVTERDGRTKVVLGGCATPEMVRAFMSEWAPSEGLTGIYGDPARGFAGGYLP